MVRFTSIFPCRLFGMKTTKYVHHSHHHPSECFACFWCLFFISLGFFYFWFYFPYWFCFYCNKMRSIRVEILLKDFFCLFPFLIHNMNPFSGLLSIYPKIPFFKQILSNWKWDWLNETMNMNVLTLISIIILRRNVFPCSRLKLAAEYIRHSILLTGLEICLMFKA